MTDCVERWLSQLRTRVATSEDDIARRCDVLVEFCAGHGIEPDQLVTCWDQFPELLVRRRPGSGPANLAVESFLIHNGVNVFGDIVCVPGRRIEDLAEQGAQFVPRA